MTDFFAVLREPRRPWIDPDSLKVKFRSLSADLHPDHLPGGTEVEKRFAQDRFTELNAAYQSLWDPRTRLQHLLELETGTKPKQIERIPADLIDFFFKVGQACREADEFLARKPVTESPLLQLKTFEISQDWIDKLALVKSQVSSRQETLLARLKELDEEWMTSQRAGGSQAGTLISELTVVYRQLSYFNRWSSQIQERILQLSF